MAASMCSGLGPHYNKLLFRKSSLTQTLLYRNAIVHGLKTDALKLQNDKLEKRQNKMDKQGNKLYQTDRKHLQQHTWGKQNLQHKKSYWAMIESRMLAARTHCVISDTHLQTMDKEILDNLIVNYINKDSAILNGKNEKGRHWLARQKKFIGNVNIGKQPFNLSSVLEKKTTVNMQLLQVDNILRQKQYHQIAYFMVYNEIRDELMKILPQHRVDIHGSSASNLGRRGSDLDIVVGTEQRGTCDKIGNQLKLRTTVHSLHVEDIFSNARVPIIKLKHLPTNISCDISVREIFKPSSNDPTINSEMLYAMSSLDDRFGSLVRIIKFWASRRGLCEEGHNPTPHGITWTLLTLFYLQQRNLLPAARHLYQPWYLNTPLIPTSDELLLSKDERLYHPTGTEKIRNFVEIAEDLTPDDVLLVDLLKGFCDYYSKFEFQGKWISIYDGKSYWQAWSEKDKMVIPLEFKECSNPNVAKNVNSLVVDIVKKELFKLRVALDNNNLVSVFGTSPRVPKRKVASQKGKDYKKKKAALKDMIVSVK